MKISEMITDRYKLRIPPTVYYELLADVREVEENQEPTTKNDLGVDCIVDVLGSYTDLDIPYKREIAENILTKLPSVTPQEPFINKACVSSGVCEHDKNKVLDKLRAEITTLQHRCYSLTKGTMCAFCKYECHYKAESEEI